MITFEAVTKRYQDGTVAVDALDLTVPAGKTVVLVGPSGCGKTTSLRMINRLVEPTLGAIFLDGTWNTLNNNTNVWRLKSLTAETADQRVYYSQGVGTRRGETARGGITGWGIDSEIIERECRVKALLLFHQRRKSRASIL